jgi:phosphatidylserine/phosphatidylglycerophosphate/cardiolipin synthase-like enzyme
MHSRPILLRIIIGIVLIAILTLVVGQVTVANIWLKDADCIPPLRGTKNVYQNAKLQFLPSLQDCAYAMHSMIINAKECFCASFYLFEYDPLNANVVTQRLGDALRTRAKNPIRIVFVLNSMFWRKGVEDSVRCTLARWRDEGVPSTTLDNIEWYIYNHKWYNNIHTKIACADRGNTTLVWSGNVEIVCPGHPDGCRLEIGVLLRDCAELGRRAHEEIEELVGAARRVKYIPAVNTQHVSRMEYLPAPPDNWFNLPNIRALYSPVGPWQFWSTRRDTTLAKELGDLILNANVSIDIFSPNVNDPFWWKCIRQNKSAVRIRFLTEQNMDAGVAWVQKYLGGNRTNTQFYNEIMVPSSDSRVEMRTNDTPGIHAKMWVIDNDTVVVGSMNFTVFSTRSSSENALIIPNNSSFATYCTNFFQQHWEKASSYT